MCDPVTIGLGAALIGGMAVQQDKQRKATNTAADQAKQQALITNQRAEEATNKANQKTPDVASLMGANMRAGQNGGGSTMLTGPGGIDPSTLTLGKNTLLGG